MTDSTGDAPVAVPNVPTVPEPASRSILDRPDVMPGKDAYTGKLPKDLVDRFVDDVKKDAERFQKLLAESDAFDIQVPHVMELSWSEPFLGSLSRRLVKHRALWIPTAGVAPVHGVMQLIYNPIFMHQLSLGDGDKQVGKARVRGVLKHELFHVIFEHVSTRRTEPHVLWNIATDCAINSLIPRVELPGFVLVPGELSKPRNPPPGWKPSLISKKIAQFPKEKASDWYMHELLSDPEIKQAMQRAKDRAEAQAGKPDNQKGQGGAGQGDPGDQQGQAGDQGIPGDAEAQARRRFNKELEKELFGDDGGQMDDHSIWDELTDAQRDKIRDAMRDIFRDCVREAEQRADGWGSIPSSMQQHLRKLVSNEVDWRDLLANFIGRARTSNTTSTYKRMSRRCPWDFPGRKRAYTCHVGAAVDMSGSMSNIWIELLFAELSNLGNVTTYDVLPFDTEVQVSDIQKLTRGRKPEPIRVRQGGTDFNAPVQYVNDHPDQYDALVILTDGGCGEPVKCEKPVLYILAPGQKLMFTPPPGTQVVHMTDTRKDRPG